MLGKLEQDVVRTHTKQQNKIIKVMNGIKWNDYVKLDQVHYSQRTLKVLDIANLELAKFMHCYNKNKVPNLFTNETYFTPIHEIHSYNIRSSSSKCYFIPSVTCYSSIAAGKVCYIFEERNYRMQYRVQ